MPPFVDSALVDQTWRRLGALPPRDMLALQRQSGKLQPELVGFVLGYTSRLSPEAVGLALYLMVVTIEMFRSASPRKMRKVKDAAIMRLWRESEEAIRESLAPDTDADPLSILVANSSEPAVLEYIFDALTDTEQEDPVELSADELKHLLTVLRTLSEGLHLGSRHAGAR
jgi:hypothetical protein